MRHPDGEHADWRLALLHHPWDYLAEFDTHEARQSIHQHRDLLLRGHLHEGEASFVHPPDPARACLELAAGCVYDGSKYPNAFQWIELYARPKRVRVLFRVWVKGAWTVDRNQPECTDGETTFDLTLVRQHRANRGGQPPAPDPRKYLQNLYSDTAHIEIRGLVTGSAYPPRFPIADLYIELQAAGGADYPLCAALRHPHLVISGDPGCGKSTFLRWVAQCIAVDRLEAPGTAGRRLGLTAAPLPVLVRIGQWLEFIDRTRGTSDAPKVPDSPDWLPVFLGAHAAEHQLGLDAAAFRQIFADGEAMILLDGLDEAPDRRQRAAAARIIEQVALTWPRCPLVVTSRPAALAEQTILPGFAQTAIERLDESAIVGFLDRWSRALFQSDAIRAEAHRRELAAALASRPEIRRLARNAVMLTALAVVHWNDKRLPEQRAELYESIVRWLLLAREDRPTRVRPERSRQLLADLALAMQSDPKGRAVQVSRHTAAERIAHRFPAADPTAPEPIDQAERYLAEEELDSGIVVRRGHDLCYWHLTFQEYLAACALAGRPDAERTALLLDPAVDPPLYRPEWRETVLLLGGVFYLQGQDRTDALVGAVLDRLGATPTRANQARAAGLIGALVRDLAPFGYQPVDQRYAEVLNAATAVFDPRQASTIPLPDRISAAEALAQVGDPRLGWDNPKRWVELPGGRFLMGAQKEDAQARGYDPHASAAEYPPHNISLRSFQIARFPVTVAEYAEFLDDEDHADLRWWQAGGAKESSPEPNQWEDQQVHPSYPVAKVSWYQAMAYCAWLTDRLARPHGAKGTILLPPGRVVRLPTEAEWEYAARGTLGRRYPWGDVAPNAQHANFEDTKVGSPSPVGVFPGGATPQGVLDLAGNVLEWCLDAYRKDFYAQCHRQGLMADPVAQGDGRSSRVQRGGGFDFSARGLRSSNRDGVEPADLFRYVGFRCVLAAPSQPLTR